VGAFVAGEVATVLDERRKLRRHRDRTAFQWFRGRYLGAALSLRLGNALVSYIAYIGKTFWPANLAVFYPHPQHSLLWSDVAAAAVILSAITLAVLYFHRARYLTVAGFSLS